MLEPTTPLPEPPSVSWRHQVIRRSVGTLGAAIVLATVGPAIANAAGGDVANPIAVALRSSGKGLVSVFTSDDEPKACVTPTADPTVDESAEPSLDPSLDPSPEPLPEPSESVDPDATVSADPSAEPSAEPTTEPSDDPAEECEDDEEAEPTASPSETPAETPTEDDGDGNHGQIVSTVAHCAPRGKDPLLDVEGTPSNHGGYVRVAAHGGTLTLPWGTYDLSTQAGADDLCASLEAAAADLADEASAEKDKKAKKDKADRGRPDKAKGGKGPGKGKR